MMLKSYLESKSPNNTNIKKFEYTGYPRKYLKHILKTKLILTANTLYMKYKPLKNTKT